MKWRQRLEKKILWQSAKLSQPLNFPFSTFVHCHSMYQQNSMMCRVRPFSVNSVDLSLVDKTIPPFRSNPARPLDYFDVNSPPASKYYFCPSIYSMGFYSSWWFSSWFLVQASLVAAIACRDQQFPGFLAVVSLCDGWKKWILMFQTRILGIKSKKFQKTEIPRTEIPRLRTILTWQCWWWRSWSWIRGVMWGKIATETMNKQWI